MKKFSISDKIRGEKLVYTLSEKAQQYYFETEPLAVFQTVDGEIFVQFTGNPVKCASVAELEKDFEASQEEMENYEEA